MGIVLQIESIEAILLIASVVAIVARRLHLPYTVGLLVAGVLVSFTNWKPPFEVTKDLIFTLFLPPLVFEAAFLLRWDSLRKNLAPLLTMATVGVGLSTVVLFTGFTYILHWDWRASLLFATLVSATDPVAVIAMLKEAGVHGRFRLLIESESLMNDGTAAALFAVALLAVGTGVSTSEAVLTFIKIAVGGVISGAAVGFAATWLMGRTEDHLVEITCTVLAAYGAFLFAEHFHFSGVLATVTAGIMVGNLGPLGPLTARGRDDAESFWEFLAFLVNSVVFILMGTRIAKTDYIPILGAAVAAVLFVSLGRAVSVYGVSALFQGTRYRLPFNYQHLLVWGGMRGALALALALGLPDDLPMRHEVIEVTFAIVAFSTIVQGMTMPVALRKLLPQSDRSPEPVTEAELVSEA